MKTFSIVIPAYNQPLLLKRAIDSVLRQDMDDYEIIVCDDSLSPDVRQYVERLDIPSVIYRRHEATGHAADNWDFGLQLATGKYVILMHHDEAMRRNDYLSRIARQMEQGADIAVSNIEAIRNGKQKARHLASWMKRAIIAHPTWLFLINAIGPSACIAFRREKVAAFDGNLEWLVDVEWYYRLLKGNKAVYVPDCCIQSIHGHADQISSKLDIRKSFLADKQRILQTYKDKRVRLFVWLYGILIIGTKKILGKI